MIPPKKPESSKDAVHPLTVDDENELQPTNEQEEEGGGYARPRELDAPGKDRPSRGGS